MSNYRHKQQIVVLQTLANGDFLVQDANDPTNVWVMQADTFNNHYEVVPGT